MRDGTPTEEPETAGTPDSSGNLFVGYRFTGPLTPPPPGSQFDRHFPTSKADTRASELLLTQLQADPEIGVFIESMSINWFEVAIFVVAPLSNKQQGQFDRAISTACAYLRREHPGMHFFPEARRDEDTMLVFRIF